MYSLVDGHERKTEKGQRFSLSPYKLVYNMSLCILESLIETFESEKRLNHTLNSLSRRSRWSRARKQCTPTQRLRRETKMICAKLSLSNKDKILHALCVLYDEQIDNVEKLRFFLDIIMHSLARHRRSIHHRLTVDIIRRISLRSNGHIQPHEFKQCVQALCNGYFEKATERMPITRAPIHYQSMSTDEFLFEQSVIERQETSVIEFIARLIAAEIIEYEAFGTYLHALCRDGIDQHNVTQICCAFRGISKLLRRKLASTQNVCHEMECFSVQRHSHLAVHGYVRSHKYAQNVPSCLKDICVVFYDAHWFIMQWFERLQAISSDKEQYSVRIRMLILNMLGDYASDT